MIPTHKKGVPAVTEKPLIGIIMGSYSDLSLLEDTLEALREFAIPFEARALSAHRTPYEVAQWAGTAEERGLKVIIAAAGGAAALAGVVAAHTILPVIGIPVPTAFNNGMDSLLSTVQMPAGIPVATVACGGGGPRNAGLLAISILALGDPTLTEMVRTHRRRMAAKVLERDHVLQNRINPPPH